MCVGSATIDNFLSVSQPFVRIKLGDKVLVNDIEKHSGGGATNSAVALAKFGLKVKTLTKLGSDHDAEFIVKEIKQHRIENICLHHSQKKTDFSTVINFEKEHDRIIFVHKGASEDLSLNDFKKSQLNTHWIYLATLMGKSFQVAKQIAEYSRSRDINLLFNPSLYLAQKGKDFLKPLLKSTTVLVLNREEAHALLGTKTKNTPEMLSALQVLGPNIVIITDGPRKLYALNDDVVYSLLPPKVKIVHTAGAGDAFTAAFLGAYIKGYSFVDCLKSGQVNACSVIQAVGVKHKLLCEKEALQEIKKYKMAVNKHGILS